MGFQSTKVIELGSAAFRQWRADHSHCRFVHGYQLKAKFWFSADDLDDRNWVFDFGGMKELKSTLQGLFDHKLVVAADDPALDMFKSLENAGACELTVLEGGVGCERFAKLAREITDSFVADKSNGRVRCIKCEIFEHQDNSAVHEITYDHLNVATSDNQGTTVHEPVPVPMSTPPAPPSKAAHVGPNNHSGSLGDFWRSF